MHIALIEPLRIPGAALEKFASPLKAQGHTFVSWDTKAASQEEMIARVRGQEIVIIANTPFPAVVVRAAEQLKLLNVAFTGIDHVAVDACREKGITVCNCANYSNQSVAEMTLGLALSLLRHIPDSDGAIRGGEGGAGWMGREIAGRTVGVVGTGRIGAQVIRLFQAFGARVVAFSRTEKPELQALGVTYLPLDQVLRQSDIVTLHVPSTRETRHMIGAKELALMGRGSLLINCARGPVVDALALRDALNEERIAGAAVDVYDQEPPLPSDHPLFQARHLIMTPHTAYLTEEAMLRRAEIAFGNVAAYLRGESRNVCV